MQANFFSSSSMPDTLKNKDKFIWGESWEISLFLLQTAKQENYLLNEILDEVKCYRHAGWFVASVWPLIKPYIFVQYICTLLCMLKIEWKFD